MFHRIAVSMKTKPFQLSKLEFEGFTLLGYSVAGEESVIVVPEMDVVFDIGRCPREALRVNHVLLSHGHMDHAAGIAYYFSQRDFQGISGGVALVSRPIVKPLENLMRAVAAVEGHPTPYKFIGMSDGDDYEIRRGLIVRAFTTHHIDNSLGFSLIEVRHKLKDEFIGKSSNELVELKKSGVEITRRVEIPLIAYLGDTAKANYSDLPFVRDAKVLLVECTFFEPEHISRARAGRHLHVTDLPEVLKEMNNEFIVLTHVTRRTSIADARKFLKKTLPADLLGKITFLMSRQHISPDE